jgi:MFS superfamily sulfate permease-like transporter/CRP-like cAMP-binding protein
LFAPPPVAAAGGGGGGSAGLALPSLERPRAIVERQVTERRSNKSFVSDERVGTDHNDENNKDNDGHTVNQECAPLLSSPSSCANDQQTVAATASTGAMTMTTPKSSPRLRKQQEQQQHDYNSMQYGSVATTPVIKNKNNSIVTEQQQPQQQVQPSSHARVASVAAIMPSIHEGQVQTLDEMTALNLQNNSNNGAHGSRNEHDSRNNNITSLLPTVKSCIQSVGLSLTVSTTYIGSFMYLLYHVVFCLALGSAIMRPSSPNVSLLGLMTKTAALGTVTASPIYWANLSNNIPALYPTGDLFLAPFLAQLALDVDKALSNELQQRGGDQDAMTQDELDSIFLSTFGALTAIAAALSATLLISASIFKLANLGSFLPYPVICGFFAAVGIMTWSLSVSIDTGGKHVGAIIMSGDIDLVLYTLTHHVPTISVAILMKFAAPKNPFFVPAIIMTTIGMFYTYMGITGTSLDQMKDKGWFWSHDDLVHTSLESATKGMGFDVWAPPAPFGVWKQLYKVHWGAVQNGMSNAVALSFLYLIRCSVHGAALKKNIPNLVHKVRMSDEDSAKKDEEPEDTDGMPRSPVPPGRKSKHSKMFSEAVDIEAVLNGGGTALSTHISGQDAGTNKANYQLVHAKPTNITLKEISATYGCSQLVVVLTGGFPITPSVAASSTMYGLGAGGLGPQIGSVLLLLVFYLTDFQIVQFVPKPAFSSMLILAAIDMIWTWAYKSWFKVKDKYEWLVVPAIVVSAFTLDLLTAVFLGIAFSTLIFVAAFFRSGVVKYVSNGRFIHSTIERPFRMSDWLDENGNSIQVIVLQNYLFFGNATSVYAYIGSIFDSEHKRNQNANGGPSLTANDNASSPTKYLLLDLTLVTGMDTSAVDVFQDIRNLCQSKRCKLFVAGMTSNLRSTLALGGFKPDGGVRSKRQLRFFAGLDAALGKAEDMLLDSDFHDSEHFPQQPVTLRSNGGHRRGLSRSDNGFRAALRHIDTEHGDNFALQLVGLQEYTTLVELRPGERLYEDGDSEHLQRGLTFIELGVLKIEHTKGATTTRGGLRSLRGSDHSINDSVRNSAANGTSMMYGSTLDRIQQKAILLNSGDGAAGSQTLRIARIGPGWVVGTLEAVSGMKSPGENIAVSYCRLHHLGFDKIKEIEEKNPVLVLALYRLLSYLMARRQEATIAQLATLHTIMSSPGGVRDERAG